MSDSPRRRDDHPTGERARTDGGTGLASATAQYRNVDPAGETHAAEAPAFDGDGAEHLFGPAQLPRWALSLPAVAALAVAVGAQGSAVLATGGGSAWSGTVVAAVGLVVVLALTLRSV